MSDDGIHKIYKLFVPGIDEMPYIGYTNCPLPRRFTLHKCQALSPTQNKTRACVLFQEGNEVVIELLEELADTSTKDDIDARERHWIEQYPECLNRNIPGRKWDERHLANREHNLNRMKTWREANKEHVLAYNKAIRPVAREQEKERYANGYGDVRNAKKKEKATCPICQKIMNKNSLWLHTKTVHAPTS
jgi:hypothetical protein